jgi:hypothetical protein
MIVLEKYIVLLHLMEEYSIEKGWSEATYNNMD